MKLRDVKVEFHGKLKVNIFRRLGLKLLRKRPLFTIWRVTTFNPFSSPLNYKKIKRKSQKHKLGKKKFIFNKKLGMLFENRIRKVFGHFHAQQIGNKQILKYLTLFQNFCTKFLKHVRFDITVKYRLHLRTHFACFTPELGAGLLTTSIGGPSSISPFRQ